MIQTPASFTSGMATVDDALSEVLQPGNFLLAAGPTGGGKTILACQFAGNAFSRGIRVLYISTTIGHDRCDLRLASAFCDIPYKEIFDRIIYTEMNGFQVPCSETYGEPCAHNLLKLKYKSDKFCRFAKFESGTPDSNVLLEEILEEAKEGRFYPQLLILDQITMPYLRPGVDMFATRAAMLKVPRAMKRIATENNILAIAFCQADVDHYDEKDMDASSIAECKALADPADAFIGISHLYADAPGEGESEHASTQHFTVIVKGCAPQLIPVRTNFAYQRFENLPEEEYLAELQNEEFAQTQKFEQAAFDVIRKSENQGYVLMNRTRFREICALGNPNCINLYYFLLLVAGYHGNNLGISFWARDRMAPPLGLTVKKIRTASEILRREKFITINKGKSLRYKIADWETQQKPESTANYLKLFRNLLDPSKEDLLRNPELFRLWLYCLANARAFDDHGAGVAEGHFLLRRSNIEEQIGISPDDLEGFLKILVRNGRINRSNAPGDFEDIEVVNWYVYQAWVCRREE